MRRVWLVLVAAALMGHGGAEECEPIGPAPDVAVSGYYVEADACGEPRCVASLWVYEETNGMAGLQRSDEALDQTCGGMLAPDTLVAGTRR